MLMFKNLQLSSVDKGPLTMISFTGYYQIDYFVAKMFVFTCIHCQRVTRGENNLKNQSRKSFLDLVKELGQVEFTVILRIVVSLM